MVNICSRNEKNTVLLGKDELRVYVGVAIIIQGRTKIEFDMKRLEYVICLKTQSSSRSMCMVYFQV